MLFKTFSGDGSRILWETELPTLYEGVTSPDFSLLHCNCYMNLTRAVDGSWILSLFGSDQLEGFVKVHVVDENESLTLITNCSMRRSKFHSLMFICPRNFKECEKAEAENKVTLVLDFWCLNFSGIENAVTQVKEEVEAAPSSPVKSCTESLVEDFQKLLEEGKEHDLELKCGDKSIPAHKTILCARSTVFAAMLRSDMQEGRSGVVDIVDMELSVLQHFLRYVYCGKLPELTVELASHLFNAGDKYAVKALMRRCSEFLTKSLTEDNACEFLMLADDHSDQEFKEATISYIVDTKVPKKYSGWSQFCSSRPLLGLEVLNRYMLKN